MRVLAGLVGQFCLVCLGYVAATFAVGAFAAAAADGVSGGVAVIEVAVHGPGAAAPAAVALGLTVAVLAGNVAFLPAVVAIAFAETFGVRSVFFYLLAAVAIAVFLAAPAAAFDNGLAPEAAPIPFLIACGAVGGAVYWVVAGRRAGRWRQSAGGGGGPSPDMAGPRGRADGSLG